MNAKKVTTGKPMIGGSVYAAPIGTTLPTSASATLASAFKELGYISANGIANDMSRSTTPIKAWGGDTVLTTQTEKNDIWTYRLIEALNIEVLKQVFGADNVTVDGSGAVKIAVNSKKLPAQSWVFDMLMSDGSVKRSVVPEGEITNVGTVNYTDSDAVGYDVTMTAYPDTYGNTHYEYIEPEASL